MKKITIEGIEIFLSSADDIITNMVGAWDARKQLMACWLTLEESDIPLSPRIVGPPGVGKTTLGCQVAKDMGLPVYIFQCTMDTRPEDLIITPVLAEDRRIRYHASSLVSAMINGGICILDEGNRMSEKAWASLAPLFDYRRYVESLTAGIKIKCHPNFRCCITMNDDASTYEVPEYILSRLQPQIYMEYPSFQEEKEILKVNVPFAKEELIDTLASFLSRAHKFDEPFTSRDGIHILRYTLKQLHQDKSALQEDALNHAIDQTIGKDALNYLNPDFKPTKSHKQSKFEDELDSFAEDEFDDLDDLDDDDF